MPPRRLLHFGRTALLLTLLAVESHLPAAQSYPQLRLTSPSFSGAIPARYASCPGESNLSPALAWDIPPAATRSFALLVTDPDAPMGVFTHWLLWNLPRDQRSLPESGECLAAVEHLTLCPAHRRRTKVSLHQPQGTHLP